MYRLLWVTANALHDTSSGAALQSLVLLRYLRRLYAEQLEIQVLCTTTFDDERGAGYFSHLRQMQKDPGKIRCFEEEGITFSYVTTSSTSWSDLREAENQALLSQAQRLLREFRPDVLIGYSDGAAVSLLRCEAHALGIPVVNCVYSPSYVHRTFASSDLLITDSRAMAAHLARSYGNNVIPVGIAIEPQTVVAAPERRHPQYVTLVNPSPTKGLSIFARLTELCRTQLPEVRFMVVESRGGLREHLVKLHEPGPGGSARCPFAGGKLPGVKVVPHTRHMADIYAQTAVLLAPSLWMECWGRVATEAVMNSIPVLCSDTGGGLPEAAGVAEGASIALVPPEHCRRDFMELPTPEETQPWVEALRRLLAGDHTQACAAAAARHAPERTAARVWELLLPLLRRRPSLAPAWPRGGLNVTQLSFPAPAPVTQNAVQDRNPPRTEPPPQTRSAREPLTAWLHIGTHKTGTTALQNWLYTHRKALQEQGVLYPECCTRDVPAGLCDHNPLHYAARSFTQPLREELRRSGAQVLILSGEDLFFEGGPQGRPYAQLRSARGCAALVGWLRELGVSKCRVLVYLRQSVALATALYVQSIQDGRDHAPQFTQLAQALGASRTWLEHWIKACVRDNLRVRLYEPETWIQGSLLHDFADAVGLSLKKTEQLPPANVSVSLLELELLRPLNAIRPAPLWRPESPRGRLWARVKRGLASSGAADERFALPQAVAREVERRCAPHEEWVRREFFPGRTALFAAAAPPRGAPELAQLAARHWAGVAAALQAVAEALPGGREGVLSELRSRSAADVTGGLQVLAGMISEERLPQDTPCLSGLQLGQALAPVLCALEERLP